MAGYRISIEVDGKAEFDRVFRRMDLSLSDLTPVWKEVGDEFHDIEREQFQSGGAAGRSGKWKPLSEKYEAQKVRKYGTFALLAGTLIATEALYKSLTRKTSDSIIEIDRQGITIGTRLPYAKYHQRGSGRLPKREVISFSDRQKNRMMKRIQKTMLKEMRRQGVPLD